MESGAAYSVERAERPLSLALLQTERSGLPVLNKAESRQQAPAAASNHVAVRAPKLRQSLRQER